MKLFSVPRRLSLKAALFAVGALSASMAMTAAHAAFGLTSDTNFYTVDTGAGLVFKVRRTDPAVSLKSPGDIASIVFNGIEAQDQARGSHIASGFNSLYTGVSAVSVNADATSYPDIIKITVVAGSLTQYYIVKNGLPHIYMATYVTAEPSVGELRWITRLTDAVMSQVPPESDLLGNTGAIESSDVFGFSSGANQGQSRSKYYGNQRTMDYGVRGVAGSGIGAFMVYGNRERASGGPFFRDIQNQSNGASLDAEFYNYMNSGHNQTEAFRMGLHGPYALLFTNGETPAAPDLSWVGALGLAGYVAPVNRGGVTVAGLNGRDANYTYTVGFANTSAQYWTVADAADGHFTQTGMLPGNYTMTVYKNELAVDARPVVVTANADFALNPITITADPSQIRPLWRIGDWDGTPKEFRNADKINLMHPADVRMSPWTGADYVVGTSTPAANWPAYQWKDVNGALTIRFNLKRGQAVPYTLRVGITAAYNGARPKAQVNGWVSGNPAISTQPSSRSLTIGTYRGNNAMYTFDIPASELVVGQNVVTITAISGTAGTQFLSPGYSIDAVDWVPR